MSYEDTRNRLKGILVSQDIEVKRKGDPVGFKFKVRPLSAREFAVMTKGKSQSDIEEVGTGFALIENVLTTCVEEPKIVRDKPDQTPADCVSIDSLPMDVSNKIFEEVFRISGLSPEEDEESKN